MKRNYTSAGWWGICMLLLLGRTIPLAAQTLIWSDEFNTPTLDDNKWTHEVGGGGFGNGEIQYYTAGEANVFIGSKTNATDTGYLVIEARRENYGISPENRAFTSGRINTMGKFAVQYGTIEARMKLPDLQNGLWPAFWMLGANYPSDGWPSSGEIDILEAGFQDDWQNGVANQTNHSTVHWFQDNYQELDPNAPGDAWHDVAIPLSAFGNVEFRSISTMFYLVGDSPDADVTFAIDDIYWENGTKVTPEQGDYILYSDTQTGVDTFVPGEDGNIYVWEETLVDVTATPAEGSNVLAYTHNNKGWFGAAFTPSKVYNLTAFANDDAALVFSLKTADTTTPFYIGMKSSTRDGEGQKWIAFEPGETPYGFERDGTWQTVQIPMSDLYEGVDLMEVTQLFEILGVGNITDLALDNIYFTGGGTAEPDDEEEPETPEPAVNLALGQPATASSTETAETPASAAVDGDTTTRWSSAFADPQWIYVDLGSTYDINAVTITWEEAYAQAYEIQVSTDLSSWTTLQSVTDNTTLVNEYTGLTGTGRYVRIYGTARGTEYGYSIYELAVYGEAVEEPANTNLALHKTVTVSSTETTETPGSAAVDGDATTRWSSTFSDPQWLQVDLGATYTLDEVKITWEDAYATDYVIEVSDDATTWTTVQTVTGNTTLENDFTDLAATGQYVRVYGTARATAYGYSIYELEVYGATTAGATTVTARTAQETTYEETVTTLQPYPNPTSGLVTLKGFADDTPVLLTSTSGQVTPYQIQKEQINVQALPPGLYILQVYKGTQRFTQKLMKQ